MNEMHLYRRNIFLSGFRKWYSNNFVGFIGFHCDVPYGSDETQVLDLFFPAGEVKKAILMVHGGSWNEGSKNKMKSYFDFFHQQFPTYALANMNYRLAVENDPGYPKQLKDLDLAIQFLRFIFCSKYTEWKI